MLSKRESKYRYKIIYENHLKKDMQKYLDEYITSKSLTYKYFYLSNINILAQYRFDKISNTIKNIGSSFIEAANSFKAFSATIENYAKWQAKQQARGYYYD